MLSDDSEAWDADDLVECPTPWQLSPVTDPCWPVFILAVVPRWTLELDREEIFYWLDDNDSRLKATPKGLGHWSRLLAMGRRSLDFDNIGHGLAARHQRFFFVGTGRPLTD
jgi:hypothetical protein